MDNINERKQFAVDLCQAAGAMARTYFEDPGALRIDRKGRQDWVSEADQNVETFIRDRIAADWPGDGIFGEEHGVSPGTSGFDWVIDPIDGTTNFVNGLPNWTVVLAGVSEGRTQLGVIHDPNVGETFVAVRGGGATLNGRAMQVADGVPLEDGTIAIGFSNRVEMRKVLLTVAGVFDRGAMIHRNASGALSLAYVASGRLLGYLEEHMNAWDCLAGQLMIEEAGGVIEDQDANRMIADGGRVIAAPPEVFDALKSIADTAWND